MMISALIGRLREIRRRFFVPREEKENEKELEAKRVSFYNQFISTGDLVFDVGANMGNRVRVFLQLRSKVVAIEPQSKCFAYLKKKYGDKILLVKKGLGPRAETKKIHIANIHTVSTFSEEFIDVTTKSGRFGNHVKWEKTEDIEMTTLDSLIQEYGVPKFIKIDVEGFELEVLKGLSQPITFFSLEYAVPEQAQRAVLCVEQIEKINGKTLYNYSIGESMEWASAEWLTKDKMIEHIRSKEFEQTGFGDIYAKRCLERN